jgi:hypothetical protein
MEGIIMTNAISEIIAGPATIQPQQVPPAQSGTKKSTPQPKADTVTISAQGKQAVQLRTAGSTPSEELKESPIEKAVESNQGKK